MDHGGGDLPGRSGARSIEGRLGRKILLSEDVALLWYALLNVNCGPDAIPSGGTSSENNEMTEETLDTSGLKCPLPVLKAKKALKALDSGDTLRVIATDPSAVADFQNFCEATGDELMESDEGGGTYRFLIRKA